MKKILISFFVFVISISTSFSASYACYYDGYWGSWNSFSYCFVSNGSGLSFYSCYDHPSEYVFMFKIDTSVTPEKKEKWYIYSGTVEYYVSEDYPTIKDVLKARGFPFIKPSFSPPIAKRTTKATIKTYRRPWGKHPDTFNFVFDDIAIGLSELDMVIH